MKIIVDTLARIDYNQRIGRGWASTDKLKKDLFMAVEKVPNYSLAQESIIRAVAAQNGGVLTFSDCETIAARPDMFSKDGTPRKARSIVAKISRMSDVAYKAKERVTKSGAPIERKDTLVAEIAKAAGVAVSTLEGMEKSPKDALVTLRNALAG